VKDCGLTKRVLFLPPVSKEQVSHVLRYVDVGYAGGQASPLYKYGASLTKLNDYMLAGLPVLYGLGDPGNPIQESGGGIEYLPGSVEDLVLKLDSLAELDKQDLESLGFKGREWTLKNRDLQ